ncbi:GPI inositol-deacylase [Aquimarina sp. D1M17]|uniref:ABC-three component system protein n=1 Tax=Aquimarina acroporae TaxID=2937283 RepID=UPI0020C1199C|nr:ABC-three component system protein [Aquimarina acroporae]MCK8520071.1 GPI inositol-deacylase [Aquimarina acroporae]
MIKILHENSNKVNTIVVFIHGFIGSEETWIKNDKTKPLIDPILEEKLIYDNMDIGIFVYHTKLLELFPKLNRLARIIDNKKARKILPIESIAELLSTQLKYRCESYENIVLIGHSMGGLVAKRFVLDDINKNSTSKVKLYISLATPHSGSDLATYGKKIIPNCQVKDLAPLSENINKLNTEWVQCKNLPERYYMQGLSDDIVPKISGISLDRDNLEPIYSDDDHFSIIKPDNKDDIILHALRTELTSFITRNKIDEIENKEKFIDDGQYDEEKFVLKLLMADVHTTLVNQSKQAFYNAEFTVRKLNRLGIDLKELVSLYDKIKELFVLEFGDLLSGVHKNSNALVTAIHKKILSEDKNYLKSLYPPLQGLQKFGMLQQLASIDDDIWWAQENNITTLNEFKNKIVSKNNEKS